MSVDPRLLATDLVDEAADLIEVVRRADADPDRPTPSPGWTIRDQLTHLAYFDGIAAISLSDPARFAEIRDEVGVDVQRGVDEALVHGRDRSRDDLLAWFEDERRSFAELVSTMDPKKRVPWFGPDMTVASKATARIMETWAHGQDIVDALGATRPETHRLRHVAHIGVRARPNSYVTHGLDVPDAPVAVSLSGPGGEVWEWPAPGAVDRVSGTAFDFCLVVTRRRHVDDTDLIAEGPVASDWMRIAQAFAGPPGADPNRTGS